MIEMRWVGRQLQFRERNFQVDASGSFCGVTEFGTWQTVKTRPEIPPVVDAAREVVSAFSQHGVGPEFPELQTAIEKLQSIMDDSVWTSEFCVVCGEDRELQRKQKTVEYTVRNEKVDVELPVTVCPVCGTEEVAEDFGRDPVECAYETYREQHKLLKPHEIKEIRERYRLSQKS